MTQPKKQLDTFAGWAGKSSDISYYLNSHHIGEQAPIEARLALVLCKTVTSIVTHENRLPAPPVVAKTSSIPVRDQLSPKRHMCGLPARRRQPCCLPVPELASCSPPPADLHSWAVGAASRPVRVTASASDGVASARLGRPVEDTITLLVRPRARAPKLACPPGRMLTSLQPELRHVCPVGHFVLVVTGARAGVAAGTVGEYGRHTRHRRLHGLLGKPRPFPAVLAGAGKACTKHCMSHVVVRPTA